MIRSPHKINIRLILLIIYLLFFIISLNTSSLIHANEEDGIINKSDLKEINEELNKAKSLEKKINLERRIINNKFILINKKIISFSKKINRIESQILNMEDKIEFLDKDHSFLTKKLQKQEEQMLIILLSLQKIAIRPRDTMALQPFKPNDAIRSGLLLSSLLPKIKERTIRLGFELNDLYKIRSKIKSENIKMSTTRAHLIDERHRLDLIYEQEDLRSQKLINDSIATSKQILILAKEAKDIKELLEKLAQDKKNQNFFNNSPPLEFLEERHPLLSSTKTKLYKDNRINYPIAGRIIKRYGQTLDNNNSLSKGITIQTLAESSVVAPARGVIVFSGPFRGYGNILIIQHDKRYHTLLSGMDKIMRNINEIVLAGEPLGSMPIKKEGKLYIEVRRDSNPINPLPWLANQT